jgi:beta-fructofuranosidase
LLLMLLCWAQWALPAQGAPVTGTPYFKPTDGSLVGDVIPFFWKDQYHLYYLHPDREGISWHELVTKDFVNFENWGEVLPRGAKHEQDFVAATGSVIEKDGTFYLFYDGANDDYAKEGKAPQVMMRATSTDQRHWKKDPEFRFPPQPGYEQSAWRDPFVFWNESAQQYWMLITARTGSETPEKRRGCTAVAVSTDLLHWQMRAPLYAPQLWDTHECNDLFKLGDWWYLVYSSYLGPWHTQYRMARSLEGPWLTPPDDRFEAEAYYAAKTAGDGRQRYVCGWLTDRENDKDDGKWKWGGSLLVHALRQRADGTLAVKPPASILAQYKQAVPLAPAKRLGNWKVTEKAISIQSVDRFAALALGQTTTSCLIEARVTVKRGTASAGIFVRADETLGNCYAAALRPGAQRLEFLPWPEPFNNSLTMERPLEIRAGHPVNLKVILDGTAIVIYANDEVALSSRMYQYKRGSWGIFVSEGEAEFSNVSIKTK